MIAGGLVLMKRFSLLMLIAVTLAAVPPSTRAEELTAEEVVTRYFLTAEFPEYKQFLTGEYLRLYGEEPPVGGQLPPGATGKVELLHRDSMLQIYSVCIVPDSTTLGQDLYCYLANDNGTWKIEAVRMLVLMGMFWLAFDQLEHIPARTPEQEQQYQNMILTVLPDSALSQHLLDNEEDFLKLVGLLTDAPAGVLFGSVNRLDEQAAFDTEGIGEMLNSMYLNYAGASGDLPGVIDINIGGLIDNSVGYFYSEDSTLIPPMSANSYIMIRHIKGPWYLYKTT